MKMPLIDGMSTKRNTTLTYALKYKNNAVLYFTPQKRIVRVLNEELLPLSMQQRVVDYDAVVCFCASRQLLTSRVFHKEIVTACGVDSQDAVSICIVSHGLSFRDCYWISEVGSHKTWEEVNLYSNRFSKRIQNVALTGKDAEVVLTDDLYTGELTSKGTRAKCFVQDNGAIYLVKRETIEEIKAEILSYMIAKAFGLESSVYFYKKIQEMDCVCCQILTSNERELLPARDVMEMYNEQVSGVEMNTYRYFTNIDRINFTLMQLFDCVTFNSDRNRDNYGLLRLNGVVKGLYPLFDHDSCFKAKGMNGYYFPTGLTYRQTIDYLKPYYKNDVLLNTRIEWAKTYFSSSEFHTYFLKYFPEKIYSMFLSNVDSL